MGVLFLTVGFLFVLGSWQRGLDVFLVMGLMVFFLKRGGDGYCGGWWARRDSNPGPTGFSVDRMSFDVFW